MNFGRKKKQEKFEKVEPTEEVPEVNPIEKLAKETGKSEKEITVVVKELPTQTVRQEKATDGTIINYVTIEEALTDIINEEVEE